MSEPICTCDWPSDDECPRHPAKNDALYGVPDPATRRWLVKWHDLSLRLSDEEYVALKRAAMDDPQEAERLAEEYASRP